MRAPRRSTDQSDRSRRASGWSGTFSALRYRNYRLLWFGTIFMSAGTWIQQVTLGWLAYEMTGSPVQVSVVLGLRALPMLGAPIAGVVADKFDRRVVLLLDQAYLAFLAGSFALILQIGLLELWHLHAFSFLTGAGWALNNPLRQTLVGNSVPRDRLMNAIALNSMAFNSMRMIGPGIAGGMIALLGPEVNFLLQAVMYIIVVFLVLPFRAEFAEGREGRKVQSPFADLKEGLAYVVRQPATRYAILLSVVPTLTLMAFIQTQMPVFVAEDLNDSEGALLGFMYVGMGVGGFLGAVLVARFHAIEHKGRLSLVGVAGAALAVLALSQVDVWWQAWTILVAQQLFFIMVMTTNNTILQSVTPDYMRGRVMGIYMLDVGMQPLGGVAAGLLAEGYGVSTAWVVGGSVGLTLVTLIALTAPSFRRLRL
ncbi:MAG: MFS transporter [Chloroflexi bacterium]|nr:MFS transporter [Chloroflexota bacterium]